MQSQPTKQQCQQHGHAGWDWEVLGKIQVVVNNGKKLLFLT